MHRPVRRFGSKRNQEMGRRFWSMFTRATHLGHQFLTIHLVSPLGELPSVKRSRDKTARIRDPRGKQKTKWILGWGFGPGPPQEIQLGPTFLNFGAETEVYFSGQVQRLDDGVPLIPMDRCEIRFSHHRKESPEGFDSPVNTNQQWVNSHDFKVAQDFVHPQYCWGASCNYPLV